MKSIEEKRIKYENEIKKRKMELEINNIKNKYKMIK